MSRGDGLGLALVALALVGSVGWLLLQRAEAPADGPRETPHEVRPAPGPAAPPPATPAPESVPPAMPPPSTAARWSAQNAAAIEALEAGELDEAVRLFEECLAAEPDEPVFAGNLAEALARWARAEYARSAELAEPLRALERAVELAPTREDLAVLLEHWRKLAEAEAGFWTDETAHFRLSYDGERADILTRGYDVLTQALEDAYGEFAVLFHADPAPPGGAKIKVVLYERDAFGELTGVGHWAGGVYDGVVRVPVVDFARERDSLRRVLRHELVHAFVREVGAGKVPAWLNEGLAQWHEHSSPLERTGAVNRARSALQGGELFPLARLRESFTTWQDTGDIGRGYAQALAMVAWLRDAYGERIVYELAEGCAQGRTCEETFRARIGLELDTVVDDLAASLR